MGSYAEYCVCVFFSVKGLLCVRLHWCTRPCQHEIALKTTTALFYERAIEVQRCVCLREREVCCLFSSDRSRPLQTEWVINRVDAWKVALSLTLNTHTHFDTKEAFFLLSPFLSSVPFFSVVKICL